MILFLAMLAVAEPCLIDDELIALPECAITERKDGSFVSAEALRKLSFDAHGLAGVHGGSHGWMYVDRRGHIVLDHVHAWDNGPDDFAEGLARVMRDGKIGYADRKGRLVIPAIYDGAFPFAEGRARVCVGCKVVCADPERPAESCEHSTYAGGIFKTIDRKNREH